MKLLIVDDSKVVRMAIERDLESRGVNRVDQAGDGEEALRMYAEQKHDYVTMDITMPKMDGLTCLDRIMEINPEVKVLVISALRDRATAIDAVKRGACGFLCKPINPQELRDAFQVMLNE
jgi:two-component system, chemotaxis family, chemotaxis protein CheY